MVRGRARQTSFSRAQTFASFHRSRCSRRSLRLCRFFFFPSSSSFPLLFSLFAISLLLSLYRSPSTLGSLSSLPSLAIAAPDARFSYALYENRTVRPNSSPHHECCSRVVACLRAENKNLPGLGGFYSLCALPIFSLSLSVSGETRDESTEEPQSSSDRTIYAR